MSGLRLVRFIMVTMVFPFFLYLLYVGVSAYFRGVQVFTPGWLSLFLVAAVFNLYLLIFALYNIKLLSLIYRRSLGLPTFLVLDRSHDSQHLLCLSTLTKR